MVMPSAVHNPLLLQLQVTLGFHVHKYFVLDLQCLKIYQLVLTLSHHSSLFSAISNWISRHIHVVICAQIPSRDMGRTV